MSSDTPSKAVEYKLMPWQEDFIFSQARFPGMFSSWATGKTMSLIFRAMLYSEHIPDNLGVIFRKEFTDLKDSTIKDFEKYTGLKVNSSRECVLANGSVILFRHLEEINNIQNMNLGWYGLEQADEIDSEKEFMMLFGRLRRKVTPSQVFKDMGLPERSGFVIANAGDYWCRKLWKSEPMDGSAIYEATTWDNAKNLPQDFLDSLLVLKKKSPEMYRKFVENDWDVGVDQYILIKSADIEKLVGLTIHEPKDRYIIALDPSSGGDECVYKVYRNSIELEQLIMHERDSMKIVGQGMILSARWKIDDFIIDSCGLGKPIADRFVEMGKNVLYFNSASSARDDVRFGNIKSEAWWEAMEEIQDGKVEYIHDEETRKQISSTKYRIVKSTGKILMEHKEDTKKRINRSPDRADTYIMARWGIKRVEPRIDKPFSRGNRRVMVEEYPFNCNTV